VRVVIAGAGDVGVFLGRELSQQGAEVVLLDASSEVIADTEGELDVLTLVGDCTHASVLESANVERADLFVSVTGQDHTNVVAAALAADAGATRTVARVDAPGFYRTPGGMEFGSLGVYAFLCASRLVSDELFRLSRYADADFVANFAGNSVQVCVVEPTDGSPALGRPAGEIKVGKSVSLVGVVRDSTLRSVEDITRLEATDGLVLSGLPSAISQAILRIRGERRTRKVVLVGGGDVGYQLATSFADSERRIVIIERDPARCEFLAEALPAINVIHGDGTSLACLRDEHVDTADSVLAVTRADEVNLMASLLSSDLGVPRTYALVHRPGYADVYAHLKITGTAGPHDVISRMIRWITPRRGALAQVSLPETTHLLAEFGVPKKADARALSEVPLPPGCLWVAISRNLAYHAPTPGALLEPGDHVVVALPERAVREVATRIARARGGHA
jgi:trk system potassium uptake protein